MLIALCRAPEPIVESATCATHERADRQRQGPGQRIPVPRLEQHVQPERPAADKQAPDDHRTAQLQNAASHRWFRLGVAARLLERALDEHDTLALQVDPELLDVTEARGRVAPGHFDRAGRKRALDELGFVGRSVDAVRPLQCVEPQADRARAVDGGDGRIGCRPGGEAGDLSARAQTDGEIPGRRLLIAAVGRAGVGHTHPPLRHRTFADRVACRREAGHRRDIADAERGLEVDVGA